MGKEREVVAGFPGSTFPPLRVSSLFCNTFYSTCPRFREFHKWRQSQMLSEFLECPRCLVERHHRGQALA